jgi:aminopeptidase-like protein
VNTITQTTSPETRDMLDLIARLYPICRSITGDGLRQTLRIIARHIPLQLTEVPTGSPVFDWTVPNEWNLKRATLTSPDGRIIADTDVHNLHVMNYSVPMSATVSLADLKPHLHSLPDKPDWIPYRTSYYAPNWGFCLPHRVLESLPDGDYRVEIDTTLSPGSLTYAELLIPGQTDDEVLLSAHACHPSLANDNLSGIAVAVALAKRLLLRSRRYSYRFIFAPGTIGSICWLANNRDRVHCIKHGLVLSCLGDSGNITYKRSRRAVAAIDRTVAHVLHEAGEAHTINDFVPYGYDERQYCSPGFNLPVGVLMRTPNGQFPEYHTSADNLDLIQPTSIQHSLDTLGKIVDALETNARFINVLPHCEPQLGRRGLYANTGGNATPPGYEPALLWVLNYSDGDHDLLDISRLSKIPLATIATAARMLTDKSLLKHVETADQRR